MWEQIAVPTGSMCGRERPLPIAPIVHKEQTQQAVRDQTLQIRVLSTPPDVPSSFIKETHQILINVIL